MIKSSYELYFDWITSIECLISMVLFPLYNLFMQLLSPWSISDFQNVWLKAQIIKKECTTVIKSDCSIDVKAKQWIKHRFEESYASYRVKRSLSKNRQKKEFV